MDFKPCGRCGDPAPDHQGRERVGKLGLNGDRQRDFFRHAGKKIDLTDQDQIIDRAGIGNDQPHRSEPELFEGLPFLFKIFERVLLIDAMGLEKAVQFDASQAEHVTQLNFGDTARPERFEGEALQSHARNVTTTFDQMGRDSVRNVNSYIHSSTLRAPGLLRQCFE